MLAEPNRVASHHCILIIECLAQNIDVQLIQAIQRIQRMHPRQWQFRIAQQRLQRSHRRLILPLINQPRGRVARPTIRTLQHPHQLRLIKLPHVHRRPRLGSFFDDPVNPPPIISAVEIQMLLDRLRQRPGMLDHFAIHVADVQIPIGTIDHLHGTKPRVFRRNKLPLLLIGGTLGNELDAIGPNFLTMNQIAARIANECIPHIFRPPRIAAKNGDAGRAGEISGRPAAAFDWPRHQSIHSPLRANHSPGLFRTGAIHLRRRPIGRDVHQRPRHRIIRIPPRITQVKHDRLNMMAIATNEFSEAIVEAQSILPAAALESKVQCSRIE